ncbi:MAG: hypothetical protein JXQ83_01660 [Candidatus Glassbacteria bacterium]|nr:hypothetical protein [Candidatus Glassbacteria bacterium]
MKKTLNHRERVKLALEHRETDRVPIAMVCAGLSAAAQAGIEQYLARERSLSLQEYLSPLVDIAEVKPRYTGPPLEKDTDIWGVRRKHVSFGCGSHYEIDYYPLAGISTVDEALAYPWPGTEWFDYGSIPGEIARTNAGEEYCIMVTGGNIFEKYWYMRGFEQAFLDLALRPELSRVVMEKITGFCVEHTAKMLAAGKGMIDLVFTADDLGTQEGLMMSQQMWQDNIKPHHARQNRVIHEMGARVIYHSDGAVAELVPGLIDMEIDILQALQFDARGMDPAQLKEDYGDRLCFEGGVSVQQTLPFGTPEDVEREVAGLISTLGRGGGYILGPSHEIPAGTPPENITAMFDTAASFTGPGRD